MDENSVYHDAYYDHVLGKSKSTGALGKVFDIIHDITDRRGIGNEFEAIETDIKDDMIATWVEIVKKEE